MPSDPRPSQSPAASGVGTQPALGRAHRKRLANREHLLDAAETLFAQHSYGAVRVEDIAEAADLAIGTLYTHFGNKDGLLVAVAERALDRAGEQLAAAEAGVTDPVERLVAAGEAYLHLLTESASLPQFFVSCTTMPADPAITNRIRARVQGIYDDLAAKVADCIAAGRFAPVDPARFAVFLIGSWTGVLAVAQNPAAPNLDIDECKAVIRQASATLLNGLLLDKPR